MSRYQKRHSPTYTHRGHQSSPKYSKVTGYSSLQYTSPLQELMCHTGSHTICHPTEVKFPPALWWRDARLSSPTCHGYVPRWYTRPRTHPRNNHVCMCVVCLSVCCSGTSGKYDWMIHAQQWCGLQQLDNSSGAFGNYASDDFHMAYNMTMVLPRPKITREH